MLLLVDAGNTRIKWALADGAVASGPGLGAWLASGAVAHAALEQLPAAWRAAAAGRPITGALLSNVAGAALGQRLQMVLPALPAGALRWFASLPQLAGLRNGYRNPAQLGCDRFAAAIGARALLPGQAVIVANCGTATTIDAISADGVFLGGMILPGLDLMASSLARNTAQLPHTGAPRRLPDGFADNTDDAIQSGCLAAQAGAIERAHAAHRAVQCIVSGGAGASVAPALRVACRVVENIVLVGLQAAAGSIDEDTPC